MSRIRLSDLAKADLRSIWDYIGVVKASPELADRQIDNLFESLTFLAAQPLMGELREDLRPRLRVHCCGSYLILYYPMTNGIEVASIQHGARDINALFQRGTL